MVGNGGWHALLRAAALAEPAIAPARLALRARQRGGRGAVLSGIDTRLHDQRFFTGLPAGARLRASFSAAVDNAVPGRTSPPPGLCGPCAADRGPHYCRRQHTVGAAQ